MTQAIVAIVFNTKRCHSASAAFALISEHLGRQVDMGNWQAMTEDEARRVLAMLEEEYPDHGNPSC